MMRTILFIHYDPQNNKLCSLTKQIPYTPEDSEMYFIDISLADKDRLKVKELKYLNNHYNDDQPYPWLNQPSHIASCHTPIKYMYIQLLKAMQTNFFQQKKKLDKIISTYDQQNLMWQRNYLPGFDKSLAQNSLSINGKSLIKFIFFRFPQTIIHQSNSAKCFDKSGEKNEKRLLK